MSKVRYSQIDFVASEFDGTGTDNRQVAVKGGGITESKLGFSWEIVIIPAASFSFDGTRSNYTLATAASSNANVQDMAILFRNGVDDQKLVVTTASANEFSLSGTTLSVHGDITASGNTFKLKYIVGSASGAASTAGNTWWMGTVPQEPLHAKSDYFQDTSLASKWTGWDPTTRNTVTVNGELRISRSTGAGATWAGLVQTAPGASQYAITVDLAYQGRVATGAIIGVLVGEDLIANPTTASAVTLCWQTGNPSSNPADLNVYDITNYTTSSLLLGIGEVLPNLPRFLRLFVDTVAQTYQFLVSPDCRTWMRVYTVAFGSTSISGSPTTIGLSIFEANTGDAAVLISRMFRVDETSDPYLSVGGYVGVSAPSQFTEREPVMVVGDDEVNIYGWATRKQRLIKAEAFSAVPATVGNYTMAVTKDPAGTPANMLNAATFDMTTLSAYTPTSIPLNGTADNRTLDIGDVWRVQFVSDNAGLDAEGVYYALTWLVL